MECDPNSDKHNAKLSKADLITSKWRRHTPLIMVSLMTVKDGNIDVLKLPESLYQDIHSFVGGSVLGLPSVGLIMIGRFFSFSFFYSFLLFL